jgi:hypothetical protein
MVLIQPILAMIGMFALLRLWGRSGWGTFLGSLAYGLCELMVLYFEYNVHGFIFAVLPVLIYVLHRSLTSRPGYFIYLPPLIAFGLFAGYPQMMYYCLAVAGLYGLYTIYLRKDSWFTKFNIFLRLFTMFLLGLALAAIQLLPGISTLRKSIRPLDTVAAGFGVDKLPLKNLVMGIIPDFFGNPATDNYWGGGTYESFTFYVSLPALILALLTLNKKQWLKPPVKFMGIVAVTGLLLALGTPLTSWIQHLSILGLKGSSAVRGLFLYGFATSILSAFGFDQLIKSPRFPKMLLAIPVVLFIILGVTFLIPLRVSFRNTLWPTLVVMIAISLILLFQKKAALLGFVLSILIYTDMFRFGMKYLPFTRSDLVFPVTPAISWLVSQNSPFRVAFHQAELFPALSWSPFHLEALSGYDILVPKTTTDLISYINYGEPDREHARFLDIKNFNSDLLDLTDTKFVVLLNKGENNSPRLDPGRYRQVFTEGKVEIWENMHNRGRFSASSGCLVHVSKYFSQGADLVTNCSGAGTLNISELFSPDWKVKLNGKRITPVRANFFFMSIEIPRGTSQISMNYFPDTLLFGSLVSLAGLLIWFTAASSPPISKNSYNSDI